MKKTKLFHSIIAFTLILSILFSLFVFGPVTLSATAEGSNTNTEGIEPWSGEAATDFAGGDGSKGSPYLINNADQLYKVVEEYDSYAASYGDKGQIYFRLTNDIYINDVTGGTFVGDLREKKNWLEKFGDTINNPSSDRANTFNGCLDGNGHTIYGLYVYGVARAGLFAGISNKAIIKNLNIENAYIKGGEGYAGAVAGIARWLSAAGTSTPAQITNVGVTNLTISDGIAYAGGLVGYTSDATLTISNCYTNNITLENWEISGTPGGLVGADDASGALKINNSYSVGYFPMNSKESDAVCTNVYTNVATPEGNTTANIITLNDDLMKGAAAKTNMTGFDFVGTWQTVENGYPVIRDEILPVWNGGQDFNMEGEGTESSPFLIKTPEQFYAVVSSSNGGKFTGKNFKLVSDIRLNNTSNANWKENNPTSWKRADFRFIGTFDGNGHTIDGLYYSGSDRTIGLFFYVGASDDKTMLTTIKNFKMTNAYINCKGTDGVGFVAGQASQIATFESIYIDESCEIVSTTVKGVGGILGQSDYNIVMSNCAMNGTVSGASCVGAFMGNVRGTSNKLELKSCYTTSDYNVQGITGRTLADGSINVYVTTKQGTDDAVATQLTADQMKDEAAKTNMSGLSYRFAWETVKNGYPVINLRDGLWDGSNGYVVSSYDDFDGEGTKESPYLIENGDQLYYAAIGCGAGACDAKYYKLTKDIILNDTTAKNWEATANPWGVNTAERFNGTLDGDGHTIEGLYINVSLKDGRYGLFSYIGLQNSDASADKTKIAEIKNLNFVGASVTNAYASSGAEGVGIVAGQSSGKAAIENIYIDKTSKASGPNVSGVAGIVGRVVQTVTINNCAVLGTFTGKSAVGSFLGLSKGGSPSISNSYSAANVPVTVSCKPTLKNTYATVKSDTADYDGNVVLVTDEQITGDAAKINMPGLVFGAVWETVKGDYPVIVKNPIEAWDGTAAEEFADGSGTAEDPFLIENGGQLYKMVSEYSNMSVARKPADQVDADGNKVPQTYFRITKDINLGNKQWYVATQTGYPDSNKYTQGFNGVIYGDGHTIYGLYDAGNNNVAGLIPVAVQGAEIHDLHLTYSTFKKTAWNLYASGAFIGLAKGNLSSAPIIIRNCSFTNSSLSARAGASAFVGYVRTQSVNINNCYAYNNNIVIPESTEPVQNIGAFVGIADGSDSGNSIVIKDSYCDIAPTIYFKDAMARITTFDNVYTTYSSYDDSVTGLIKVTDSQLQGANAKETLAGFNFNQVWVCGEEGEYPVHKAYDSTVWNGRAAASYAGGDGTVERPYEIATPDQLYKLATADTESTKGNYYKLTADITISNIYDGWANDNPYTWAKKTAYLTGFTYGNSFAGTFDGDGHTVTGLYVAENITNGGTYAYGLIPFISANAVVKNVNIDKVKIDVNGNAYVGAVVGAAYSKGDDATNPLANAQIVGANITNGDITINGVKTDDIIIGGSDGGVKVELCNNQNKYENVISYNASNLDEEAILDIRNKLLGKNNAYITDINAKEGFNVCDLLCAKKALLPKDDNNSDKYELVWSQDFNGSELDYSVWSRNTSMSCGTTIQYGDLNNVNGESLTLYCEDANTTNDSGNKVYNVNYGLDTMNSMSFKYGRLEMRAKIPVGAGAFPSLWLSSRDAIGYIPDCKFSTEVDVFEVFGKTKNVKTAVSNIHKWYNDENGNKVLGSDSKPVECSLGSGIAAGNLSKVDESKRSTEISYEWCTVVFEWTEDTMTFSIDEYDYEFSISRSEMNHFDLTGFSTNSDGVFNQFMYPIITNHMYTTGDGAAKIYQGNASEIDSNLANLTFEIDYIRLYQKNDGKSQINLK